MILFYIDETGNRDPRLEIRRKDGTIIPGDPVYVLTAISLYEHRWHGFEKTMNRRKADLVEAIFQTHGIRLQLADCEIKSNWVRRPDERAKHPFLRHLSEEELTGLIELYYAQLEYHNMNIFSVIVDKRYIPDYMDQEKLHRKSWELLMEMIENFMRVRHPRHQALMVNDDISKEVNRSLAMKHAYLQDQGTYSGTWLKHICEMPMFVRSELSNGVQLTDLCSYNIYRAFKKRNLDYVYFQRIKGNIWSRSMPARRRFSGLYIFQGESPLRELVEEFEKERASTVKRRDSLI